MQDLEIKFIYSEKATKFCEISTLLLSVCTVDKSKVEISQNFVAFSEYTNFTKRRNIHVLNLNNKKVGNVHNLSNSPIIEHLLYISGGTFTNNIRYYVLA